MKKLSPRRAARQRRADARVRAAQERGSFLGKMVRAALRWLLRRPSERISTTVESPKRSNPMSAPNRKSAFDTALLKTRAIFPNASDDFHRDMARRSARALPMAPGKPKPVKTAADKKASRKARVAVFHRPATRAERQSEHGYRMTEKAGRRYRPVGYRVSANLSKRHQDYGCTPAEHARRKAGRIV